MKFSFNKPIVSTIVFLAICGFFLVGNATPAYADPHAVFYTVSGQQQLFFNMLAALDQADYVESAKRAQGQPTNSSREELLRNRKDAGLSPATNATLRATETSLNNILTRSITLEGQDLWTTYMRFQIALEGERRKDTAAILQFFCQRVLGLKDCQENQESPILAEARKRQAGETRGLEDISDATQQGIDVLYSGTAEDQQARRDLLAGRTTDPTKDKAYNAFISQLYKQAADNPEEQAYLANLIGGVANISYGEPNSGVFEGLTVDEDGVRLTDTNPSIDDYTAKLSGIFNLPNQLLEARISAGNRRLALNNQTTIDGARADTYAIPHVSNGELGEIEAGIRVPANVKAAQAQSIASGLAGLANNPLYRGPDASVSGQRKVLNQSGQTAGITSDSSVLGTSASSTSGQVAAAESDEEITESTDELDSGEPLDPPNVEQVDTNDNIVGSLGEDSIQGLLEQLLGGSNRGGCGCSVEGLLDGYGDEISGNP